MDVGAQADARDAGRRCRRGLDLGGDRDERAGAVEVGSGGDLEGAGIALDRDDGVSGGRDEGGVVGVVGVGGCRGRLEHGSTETLRRLGRGELRAIDRGDDPAGPVDALDRVDDGENGDHGDGAVVERRHDALEHRGRGESPGGVVHEDGVDIAPQGREPGGDGLLAGRSARDDRHELAPVARGVERIGGRVALVALGDDHHDLRGRGGEHAPQRVVQDRPGVEAHERLGRSPAQAGAGAGRDDDDREVGDGGESHPITLARADARRGTPKAPARVIGSRRRGRGGSAGVPAPERQDARTSSSTTLARSSSVFSARASSETRI
ncbi:hypothetical protein QE430_002970 [Microbacterium testaceum]|nr:hypothetical protein [Microbacterium testaceum]